MIRSILFTVLFLAFLGLFSLEEIRSQSPNKERSVANMYRITPRSGSQHISLDNDWSFGSLENSIKTLDELKNISDWTIMKRPMSVQQALFNAGKLPDPYKNLNSKQYEPLENRLWYYKKSFEISEKQKGNYAFLSFDGLDYYSRVWLNGQMLGRHSGMFGGPEFEVSSLLQYGKANELIVAVASANYNNPKYNPRAPGDKIKPWGTSGGSGVEPFFTFGMWRGSRIDFMPKVHLERPYIVTKEVSNEKATLVLESEIFVDSHSFEQELHPEQQRQLIDFSRGTTGLQKSVEGKYTVRITLERNGKQLVKDYPIHPRKGKNWFHEEWTIDNPDLWYPNGMGEAALYQTTFTLLVNEKIMDEIRFSTGIRSIEWERSAGPRLHDRWGNWQCIVNNRPFFIKGINWMPIDALLDLPREKYQWYLQLAKDAGIQIIRIWGPGLQESEYFYDACDQLGLMVWQDFPIGNFDAGQWSQREAQSQFLETIFRLRNRASLAVWCGGNEFNPYCEGNTPIIGIIERCLHTFDDSRKFVRTSPDMGSFHTYPDMDPTWYKKNYTLYPYMAESGIHSIASVKLFNEYVDSSEFADIGQMYQEKFRTLCPDTTHHFVEYYPSRVPRMLSRASHIVSMTKPTVEDVSIATQLGAGEFYQLMSEGFQSHYPVTTGMMPWVFARSWPAVAAVQLIDGTGQPLAPYYYLKRTYEPLHILLDLDRVLWKAGEPLPIEIKVLNLTNTPTKKAKVSVTLFDSTLKELYNDKADIEIEKSPSVARHQFESFRIPTDSKGKIFFAVAELTELNGNLISRSVYYPRTIPQMENTDFYQKWTTSPQPWPTLKEGPFLRDVISSLGKTELKTAVKRVDIHEKDGLPFVDYELSVTNIGPFVSPMTIIDIPTDKVRFSCSDNYFWLCAGEKKTVFVRCRKNTDVKQLESEIKVRSWNSK